MDIKHIRTRWAAVGAAAAITLGAGGIGITHATTSSGERAIYKPINPCRLADLRPAPDTVGTRTAGLGPDETYTLDGWGTVGDCTLPTGTTGLALNVTAVDPTAPTFLRLWPADGTQPTTSNLNPTPGQPPTPNAVNVGLSATGQFSTFNRFGVVSVIIDVVGVYDDHNHDDRYYTKDGADSTFVPQGEIVLSYSPVFVDNAVAADIRHYADQTEFHGGFGSGHLALVGPEMLGAVSYGLKSVSYCIAQVSAPAFVDRVDVYNYGPLATDESSTTDLTNRSAVGCYTIDVNNATATSHVLTMSAGGGGYFGIRNITATWAPASDL